MREHKIFLALGSNIGDRRSSLAAALQRLRALMEIDMISSIYETEPVGYLDQPRFLNLVCSGKTYLSPEGLWQRLEEIQIILGRLPSFPNGPRLIDIDIIFYDDLHIAQNDLSIPHPRMAERAFVLIPLAEIAPDHIDPLSGRTIQELLGAIGQGGVKKIATNLGIAFSRDIQGELPTVHVRLGRAGVIGVKKAIIIGSEGHHQHFDAVFNLHVDLHATQAGVHMSRFNDALEEVLEESATTIWPKVEVLAEYIARTIVERQQVTRAEASIHTSYPLFKWTPVSGRRTQEIYGLRAEATATAKTCRRMIGVEVEGMVACPCAQDMVHAFARVRLQEEGFPEDMIEKMLGVTPLATHNQRGQATLMIGTDQDLEVSELILLVEDAMSSENYALLKRPDELYVVNKAHARPRFAEDVAREVLAAVVKKYITLPDDTFVWVSQRNDETIHKYDVQAEGWGTLGELRKEILEHAEVEHHTTKEDWLNLAG